MDSSQKRNLEHSNNTDALVSGINSDEFLDSVVSGTNMPITSHFQVSDTSIISGPKIESPTKVTETHLSSTESLFMELTNTSFAKYNIKAPEVEILEKLSETSCSKLYKIYERKSNKIMCLKAFEVKDRQDNQEAFIEFKAFLNLLKLNPNNDFVDVVFAQSKATPEDPDQPIRRYFILIDAGEGCLKDWALYKNQNTKEWTQEELLQILAQILKQIQILYEHGIICRDIKPEHFILADGKVKMIDFSSAYFKTEDHRGRLNIVGTPFYVAPELVKAHQKMIARCQYDPVKSDSYSLAKTILKIASPYCDNLNELLARTQEKYPKVYEIIKEMLLEDPKERKSFLDFKENFVASLEGGNAIKKIIVGQEAEQFKGYILNNRIKKFTNDELVEQAIIFNQLESYKDLKRVLEQLGPKSQAFASLEAIDKIRVIDLLAEITNSEGNIQEATQYYEKAIELKKDLCGKGHSCIGATGLTLGKLLIKLQNYSKAVENYEAFIEFRKQKDQSSSELGLYLYELGILYEQTNNLAKARDSYEQALKIYKAHYGEENPKLANLYNSLGTVSDQLGFYKEALECLEIALNIKLKHVPAEHPSLAVSYNNLGLAYERFSKGKKALENYQKALNIWRKAFGEQNEHVATAYNNIGSAHDSLGDFKQAVEYYQKSLEIRRQIFGSEHPKMAQIYNNLGTSYFHLAQYEEALDNYKKCLTIWKQTYGEENNKVATVYNNMANAFDSLKRRSEAKEYFTKCVEIKGKVLGKSHPSLATTYANLAAICLEDNDKEKALEVSELAYEIRKEQLGKNNPATLEVENLVIKLKKILGKKD